MLDLKPSGQVDQRTLTFLQQHPSISAKLALELGEDIDQVATLIEPILNAPNRCAASTYYIQAVSTGQCGFLTTNLSELLQTQVAATGASWLIGRSRNCAIAILDKAVSRCHAVIKYNPRQGFTITDLGSSNGTFINAKQIPALTPHQLNDGDLLEFSKFRVEFFISGWSNLSPSALDTNVFL